MVGFVTHRRETLDSWGKSVANKKVGLNLGRPGERGPPQVQNKRAGIRVPMSRSTMESEWGGRREVSILCESGLTGGQGEAGKTVFRFLRRLWNGTIS